VSNPLLQLASVRVLPWAKANINPTGQALIISTGSTALLYLLDASISMDCSLPSTEEDYNWCMIFAELKKLNGAVAGMAYFIAADKKILSLARQHSYENAPEHLKNTSFEGTGRVHPAFFRPL
jgi:hypothetical protein